jgi:peptidyl-prolyl cis-trans isomerase B (cyclophilin B)
VCDEPTPLGRIKIGLYGALVPQTVENFLKLLPPSAGPGEGYLGTIFHRITPGGFILGGQPGSHRLGQVQTPRLPSNPELLSSKVRGWPGCTTEAPRRAADRFKGPARALPNLALALSPCPQAFEVPHLRPGTVSLALGAAAGASDGAARAQTEFLITTGPAPVPSLDGENIVFG